MTEPTDKDLRNQIASYRVTFGAQWADLEKAVDATGDIRAMVALTQFGTQLNEFMDAVRILAQKGETP